MNQDEPVILATVKDFKAPSLPPPLLSQRNELLKALESAKRLNHIKTINLINYINFSNGSVSVILLLRQLKMLISGGIGNFRMLEVIANLRRSFNERFHKGTGFRFQIFVIPDRFS